MRKDSCADTRTRSAISRSDEGAEVALKKVRPAGCSRGGRRYPVEALERIDGTKSEPMTLKMVFEDREWAWSS